MQGVHWILPAAAQHLILQLVWNLSDYLEMSLESDHDRTRTSTSTRVLTENIRDGISTGVAYQSSTGIELR